MPDVIADYKIADKLASNVERNFDTLDTNKDGKLTADELVLRGKLSTVDDHMLNASLRLVNEHISLCGHQEIKIRKVEENKDGKLNVLEFLTPDLTQNGQKVFVTTKEDLAAFRKGIQKLGGIEDQSNRELSEKELLAIVSKKFEDLDKDKDFTLNTKELYARSDELRKLAQRTPSQLLEETAIRYLAGKVKEEGESQNYPYKEMTAPAKTIPGESHSVPYMIGKLRLYRTVRDPDKHVPAQYKTVDEILNYTTPSQLAAWQKKAK